MNIEEVLSILSNHSIFIIFIIMFLESLNLSGIPSTILLPSIGIFITINDLNFFNVFLLTISASILGNILFYLIAYKFGSKLYDYLYNKFPKLQKAFNKTMEISQKYGNKACLIGRFIPPVRSFISLIAGIFKIKFKEFFFYSSIGIFMWDLILILVGYLIPIPY
ncbi:VTT domain-containing protein [Clostridium sp. D53t1_180928_C8]|uniref:DedA family protein n=1 Tax=Clostridium sp. D53t1_180928_C8 TaxID=2787101 RepID=UPI0018AB424C|nr:VTT domain-containing protein [Clostridium sp. D53t1_180928_C8]